MILPTPKSPPLHKYKRRKPENTLLYKVVQEHLETFIANREMEGKPLPKYVIKEFRAFLSCGILQKGFLRFKCEKCDEEKIVAFSCKKRGFCGSCIGKRMAEAGAHLVDNVLPLVPYRQYVISFPYPLRFMLAANKKLMGSVHKIIVATITDFIKEKTGVKDEASIPGFVTFIQLFGDGLRLTPHFHILATDGTFHSKNPQIFKNLPQIQNEDAESLVKNIAENVISHLREKKILPDSQDCDVIPEIDPIFDENQGLLEIMEASIQNKIATGPNRGRKVRKIASGYGNEGDKPVLKSARCAQVNGFSLHCNTKIEAHDREKLETLIRYMTRPPIANDRLHQMDSGDLRLKLKKPWGDIEYLVFTPEEMLEKLTAIIPLPRMHLVRFSGAFAPHNKIREKIILNPGVYKGFTDPKGNTRKNKSWAKMLARCFKVDIKQCGCGGRLRFMACIKDQASIERYLKGIGEDPRAPPINPAKAKPLEMEFSDSEFPDYEGKVIEYD